MPSAAYHPSGGLSNTNTSGSRDQLCISLSGPTLAAAEANLRNMARRPIKCDQVVVNYRHRRNAHVPEIERPYRRAAEDLQDIKQEGQVEFYPDKSFKSASNVKTGRACTRSFCTAFGKPGPLSASLCAPPSYILLSDVLKTMTNTRSLRPPATSDPDDTFYTLNDAIHVSDLPPLASETSGEELCVQGYLERPDHHDDNRFLRWLRCTFVPWVLQAIRNCWPKQVTSDAVSPMYLQPSPKAFGRCGGFAVVDALKCANIEEDPRTPPPTRLRTMLTPQEQSANIPRTPPPTIPYLSDQSIYWPCQSLLTTPNSSAFPSVQESPVSASSSCDLHEFSYVTSCTTPSSSPERADFGEMGDVLGTTGTTSSIYEAALRSCAPRVAMLNAKRPCVGARTFPKLWYAEVCHHRLV